MDINTLPYTAKQPELTQSYIEMNKILGTATLRMLPKPRPCFTATLLDEIQSFQKYVGKRVSQDIAINGHSDFHYVILASGNPDYFNLGGDLYRFVDLIKAQDYDSLMTYATACINGAYSFHTNLGQPVTSIALVEGNAQGGGFEAALSCNVIIAERGTHLGFPEVLFNMFPGMGAYSFLSRRVGTGLAERLIYSGDLYSAEKLYELGVIDVLADVGAGKQALGEYVKNAKRKSNALDLFRSVQNEYHQVPYKELLNITTKWVDAALTLGRSEIRIMERLICAQNKRSVAAAIPDISSAAVLQHAT
jgi:DSF synthase